MSQKSTTNDTNNNSTLIWLPGMDTLTDSDMEMINHSQTSNHSIIFSQPLSQSEENRENIEEVQPKASDVKQNNNRRRKRIMKFDEDFTEKSRKRTKSKTKTKAKKT
jgi:hypothetical protein